MLNLSDPQKRMRSGSKVLEDIGLLHLGHRNGTQKDPDSELKLLVLQVRGICVRGSGLKL